MGTQSRGAATPGQSSRPSMRRRSPGAEGLSHTLEVEEQLTSPSEGAQGENVPYGDAVGERRRAGLQLLSHRSLVSFTGLTAEHTS